MEECSTVGIEYQVELDNFLVAALRKKHLATVALTVATAAGLGSAQTSLTSIDLNTLPMSPVVPAPGDCKALRQEYDVLTQKAQAASRECFNAASQAGKSINSQWFQACGQSAMSAFYRECGSATREFYCVMEQGKIELRTCLVRQKELLDSTEAIADTLMKKDYVAMKDALVTAKDSLNGLVKDANSVLKAAAAASDAQNSVADRAGTIIDLGSLAAKYSLSGSNLRRQNFVDHLATLRGKHTEALAALDATLNAFDEVTMRIGSAKPGFVATFARVRENLETAPLDGSADSAVAQLSHLLAEQDVTAKDDMVHVAKAVMEARRTAATLGEKVRELETDLSTVVEQEVPSQAVAAVEANKTLLSLSRRSTTVSQQMALSNSHRNLRSRRAEIVLNAEENSIPLTKVRRRETSGASATENSTDVKLDANCSKHYELYLEKFNEMMTTYNNDVASFPNNVGRSCTQDSVTGSNFGFLQFRCPVFYACSFQAISEVNATEYLSFLRNCPSIDPTGKERKAAQDLLKKVQHRPNCRVDDLPWQELFEAQR